MPARITALSTPPSRADAATFAPRADTFTAELPVFGIEANALADEVNAKADAAAASAASAVMAPGTNATSTTSLMVATGAQALTIQTGKQFVASAWVLISLTADGTVWMAGPITSYNSGTGALIVNVQRIAGAGTYAAWTVSVGPAMLSDSVPRNLADGSTIADTGGIARAVGFRGLPLTAAKTAAYTLAVADAGMAVPTTANVTVPANATLAIAISELFAVINTGGSNITLVQAAGVTLRLSGTATTGNRTVAQHSEAFLHKINTDEWLVSGAGVS